MKENFLSLLLRSADLSRTRTTGRRAEGHQGGRPRVPPMGNTGKTGPGPQGDLSSPGTSLVRRFSPSLDLPPQHVAGHAVDPLGGGTRGQRVASGDPHVAPYTTTPLSTNPQRRHLGLRCVSAPGPEKQQNQTRATLADLRTSHDG